MTYVVILASSLDSGESRATAPCSMSHISSALHP